MNNQAQEDHCENLYKKYHILLDYVKCQWEMIGDETALAILQEIGEA